MLYYLYAIDKDNDDVAQKTEPLYAIMITLQNIVHSNALQTLIRLLFYLL